MNRLAASRPAPLSPPAAVHYPDSDGQPLAESDFQLKPLVYAYDALARRYRDRDDVYVSADLFVYCEEGNPRAVVAPDVFVVLGASSHDRRTYKLWEEPKAPDFVLEITSHGTRAEDEGTKRRVYARLGVREYWRFDPTGDWLDPPLEGERLAAGRRYARLPIGASPDGSSPDGSLPDGSLPDGSSPDGSFTGRSEVLGLDLAVVDGRLRLRDPATGRDLPASEELEDRIAELEARLRALETPPSEPGRGGLLPEPYLTPAKTSSSFAAKSVRGQDVPARRQPRFGPGARPDACKHLGTERRCQGHAITRGRSCEALLPACRRSLAERPGDRLRLPVDHGQQNAGRPIRDAATLLPILYRARIETESIRELAAAESEAFAKRENPFGSRIVDDPERQIVLPTHMGEDLAQGRLDLTADLGSFHRHLRAPSFLIAPTNLDSAFLSTGVKSSRSAFA